MELHFPVYLDLRQQQIDFSIDLMSLNLNMNTGHSKQFLFLGTFFSLKLVIRVDILINFCFFNITRRLFELPKIFCTHFVGHVLAESIVAQKAR